MVRAILGMIHLNRDQLSTEITAIVDKLFAALVVLDYALELKTLGECTGVTGAVK